MSTIKTNQLAHTANGASVYTLPQTDGSAGQILRTDGSGNLSWVNDQGGKLKGQYFATSTSEFSSSSGSFQNAHTITFTPASSTSKFLIFYLPARVTFGSNPDGEFRISDGTNTSNQYRIAGGSHGSPTYKTPSIVFWHNHTLSGSTTFTAQYRNISGNSSAITLGDNGSPSLYIVLEIEQ